MNCQRRYILCTAGEGVFIIRFSPTSSMMKLQRLCSLRSSSTDYPESFASRDFSPPELPLKVRTLFQVAVSAFSMRWKLGQQSLISRLQSSERTDHWQVPVLAVSPGPIRFFVIIAFALCFHRLLFSDKRTFIHLPSSQLMHLSSYICRPGRDCTGVPAGSGTETPSLRFFDTIGRVDGAVSDLEKDT